MPLAREPSRRMRLNFGGKTKAESIVDGPTEISEIVHLGGSRAGSIASTGTGNTGHSAEDRVTQWFLPVGPAPDPPVPGLGGLKRSNTVPHKPVSPQPPPQPLQPVDDVAEDEYDDDDDRPITLWFRPADEKSPPMPQHPPLPPTPSSLNPPPLNLGAQQSQQKPSSPGHPPKSSGGYSSMSRGQAPLPSPASFTSSVSSMRSPAQSYGVATAVVATAGGQHPRRTQSQTDLRGQNQHRPQSKALPARPMDEDDEHEPYAERYANSQRVPFQLSAPPSRPLPQAPRGRQDGGKGTPRGMADGHSNHSPTDRAGGGGRQQPSHKYSGPERLWLHRNYRGEVTFLKAWGLNFEKDADRDEGMRLMRELMAAEAEDKRSRKERKGRDAGLHDGPDDQQQHMSGRRSSSRSRTRDVDQGLHAIAEEDMHGVRLTARSDETNWPHFPPAEFEGGGGLHRGPSVRQGVERHLRSDSDGSVLEDYLDSRYD